MPWLALLALLVQAPGAGAQPAPGDNDLLSLPARLSSLAPASLLLDLADTGARLVAVGERGHILYSDDRGASWQQARVPASVTLTAVHFPTPAQGWAVGHDGLILHSGDGGQSWQKQLDGFALNPRVLAYRQRRVASLEAALAGAGEADREALERRLDDARFALDDASAAADEGPTKPLLDVWFRDARRGWAVGAYGLLLETDDGGRSWQPRMADLDNPDGFHINAVAGRGDDLYLAGEAGLLARSRDGGVHFERLESPYAGSLFALQPLDDGLLLLGMRGRAYFSADDGDRWTVVPTGTGATLTGALALDGGRVLAVGQRGTLLQSDDGGRHFSPHTDPLRRGYLAAARGGPGRLVLVGQGGVQRLNLDDWTEVTP